VEITEEEFVILQHPIPPPSDDAGLRYLEKIAEDGDGAFRAKTQNLNSKELKYILGCVDESRVPLLKSLIEKRLNFEKSKEKPVEKSTELEPAIEENTSLEKLVESSLKDIKAADLSDEEKAALLEIEKQGKNRKSVVKYLEQ